jgi:hypothetical protein
MNIYDIVKLNDDSVAQIVSHNQDQGKHAKLNLEDQMTVRFRDGREKRVKLKETATAPISNDEKDKFVHGNLHLLP